MNQNAVKEQLQRLHASQFEYDVIFSGRKSGRVNGLYKWKVGEKPEIIIHNKNFLRDDGTQNDTLLMFTAIHELAHHVVRMDLGRMSMRAHSQLFWATFHDLLDKAESMGIYRPEIDADTQGIIDEAREISKQIAELQRKLGQVILRAQKVCKEKGLRFEDMIERKAQISQAAIKGSVEAYGMGDRGVGADIQSEAAKQRNEDKRETIFTAAAQGKSVVQAKLQRPESPPLRAPAREDEAASLIKEKRRLEKTIESLARRLEELTARLEEKNGQPGINMSECPVKNKDFGG